MKIIQSFAWFNEGNNYLNNKGIHNPDLTYLSFYTFLLSYLTLKKYYNHVTMFCNHKAYNNLLKYIPYDEIVMIENKYNYNLWSLYKTEAIRNTPEDFIHVDTDVFIFDSLFDKFVDSLNYDVVVQDYCKVKFPHYAHSIWSHNKEYLIKNNYLKSELIECCSTGVLGLREKDIKGYIELVDKFYFDWQKGNIKNIVAPAVLEEFTLYIYIQMNKLNVLKILSDDKINKYGHDETANISNYTHLWFDTKFQPKWIEKVKNKIKKMFPDYVDIMDKYETDVLKDKKLII